MDKFYKLERYLKVKEENTFSMSFADLESILGFRLSISAYNYSAYWSPSPTHTLPNMILECGYRVSPNLKDKTIRFYREKQYVNKTKDEAKNNMSIKDKIFKINDVEYYVAKNPLNNFLMVARVDGAQIGNRKEVCKIFLRHYG